MLSEKLPGLGNWADGKPVARGQDVARTGVCNEKMSSCHSLGTSRQKAEANLKTYEPFTYGVVHDITNVCCKNLLQRRVICLTVTNFSYCYVYVLLNMTVKQHADTILRIIVLYLFTLHFVYSNLCCPHVTQILPKLYSPHKTLSMPTLNALNYGLQDLRMWLDVNHTESSVKATFLLI
jgi:hypothetical protein